jgi:hypothetical protein
MEILDLENLDVDLEILVTVDIPGLERSSNPQTLSTLNAERVGFFFTFSHSFPMLSRFHGLFNL